MNSTDLYNQLEPQLTDTARNNVQRALQSIHEDNTEWSERIACIYLRRLLEDPTRAEPARRDTCCRDGWRYTDLGHADPCPQHHRGGQRGPVSRERQQLTAELMPGRNRR